MNKAQSVLIALLETAYKCWMKSIFWCSSWEEPQFQHHRVDSSTENLELDKLSFRLEFLSKKTTLEILLSSNFLKVKRKDKPTNPDRNSVTDKRARRSFVEDFAAEVFTIQGTDGGLGLKLHIYQTGNSPQLTVKCCAPSLTTALQPVQLSNEMTSTSGQDG